MGGAMKKLVSMGVGAWSLLATSAVLAQAEPMMEGGRHVSWFGGSGGFWSGLLLGALVVAVVFLLLDRRKK